MLTTKLEQLLTVIGHLSPAHGGTFHPLTVEEIAEIEKRRDGHLPEEYQSFVLQYGSSAFNRMVRYPATSGRTIFPDVFYGGGEDPDSVFHINWALDMYEDRMPSTLIPIADCSEQGLICLGVKGAESGKTFFWDRNLEWGATQDSLQLEGKPIPSDLQFQNLTLLADTFFGFLSGLEVADD